MFLSQRRVELAVTLLAVALPFTAVSQDRIRGAIDNTHRISLRGSVNPRARAEFDLGRVEPSFQVGHVQMMLKQTDSQRAAIDQLLAEQQNPASPNYHQWLTPEQYADRFGASPNDIAKITDWLRS